MKYLFFILIFFTLVACNSKKDDSSDPATVADVPLPTAPRDLAYNTSALILSKNVSMPSILPTYRSSTSVVFRASPSLPTGLSLNQFTGAISGTPSVAQSSRLYTISVLNLLGYTNTGTPITQSESATFDINILIKEAPPANLTYPSTAYVSQLGLDFITINPTVSGGPVEAFTINPSLPLGMFIDLVSGQIYGRPLVSSSIKSYTVTASNSGGMASFNFNITISGNPPNSLNYTISTISTKVGLDLAASYPIYSGEVATSFTSNPQLPEGVILNSITGIISGNPSVPVFNTNYTISANNLWGSSQAIINLNINPNVLDLATGREHSCVIKNKKIFCFGRNEENQIGKISDINNVCLDAQQTPYLCEKEINLIKKQNQNLLAKQLALGVNFSCALGYDKKVYCWGSNSNGQLGIGTAVINKSENPQIVLTEDGELSNVESIGAGDFHICALTTSKDVYCWGRNTEYQVISDLQDNIYFAKKLLFASNVQSLAVGQNHNCLAMNDKAFCWGNNSFYNLGTGDNALINQPNVVLQAPMQELLNVSSVYAGGQFSLAFSNNNLLAWGQNSGGELSDGTTDIQEYPVVSMRNNLPISSFDELVTGVNSWCYTLSGNGYCVGQNDINFANNTNINQPNVEPLPILDPDGVSPMTNIDKISQGFSNHRCISLNNAQVYCFGQNFMGQLGVETIQSDSIYPKILNIGN
jgi:alpha-tubulin suppressor-like RCC1 family protein